jgi:hypothetical protein
MSSVYQLGWTTLPGLRGLSCSEFRATPTTAPDNERGVAVEFTDEMQRDAFIRQAEEFFSARRFTNAADAFDTVKTWAGEWVAGNAGEISSMRSTKELSIRIVANDAANLLQAKDEEYSYWQSRPALERLVAMQTLSFGFFEVRDNEAEIRRQFLRSPVCLPLVPRAVSDDRGLGG